MKDNQIEQLNEQLGIIIDILEELRMRCEGIEDRIADIERVVYNGK